MDDRPQKLFFVLTATDAQIRDYVIDTEINHEETNKNVAGQEWSDPTVYGLPNTRMAFAVDEMRGAQMVKDVRVLVDPARFAEATTLDLEDSRDAQVRAYIENHPEECDFDGEEFVPIRVCRAR